MEKMIFQNQQNIHSHKRKLQIVVAAAAVVAATAADAGDVVVT